MRKVTRTTTEAFLKRKAKSNGNTNTDGNTLFLHGHAIARHVGQGLEITTAGWNTPTTRDRLNAIPGVSVGQKDYQLYLNGEKWDGEWAFVQVGELK